jgi:hypothetical protein
MHFVREVNEFNRTVHVKRRRHRGIETLPPFFVFRFSHGARRPSDPRDATRFATRMLPASFDVGRRDTLRGYRLSRSAFDSRASTRAAEDSIRESFEKVFTFYRIAGKFVFEGERDSPRIERKYRGT